MPVLMKRRVTFLAKAEYFTTPGLKGKFSRWFMSAVGQVAVDRNDADAARAHLTRARSLLPTGGDDALRERVAGTAADIDAVFAALASDDHDPDGE